MHIIEWIFISIANKLPPFGFFNSRRYLFLKLAGMNIRGKGTILGPINIRALNGIHNLYIGNGCFINTEVRFGCPGAKIIICDNIAIGPRVSFETTSHGLIYQKGKGRGSIYKDIIIEDNVWIGAGSTIILGVTIGKGAVIAAGSVATKNIAPYTLVGGVPAKKIKYIQVQ